VLLVELGGIEPPSRTPFYLLHTAISVVRFQKIIILTVLFKLGPIIGYQFVNPISGTNYDYSK
jgi:hypothetical protein